MNEISYEEFIKMVNLSHDGSTYRYGQTYFNVLYEIRPALADRLRGGPRDPFHKNLVPEETHDFVKSIW